MGTDTVKSPINLDQFEIVKTGTANFPSISGVGGGAGNFGAGEAITTIAHGLGFTPVIIAFLQEIGASVTNNFVLPSFSFGGFGTATATWLNFQVAADSTNFYIITDLMAVGTTGSGLSATGITCQYYLLRERIKRSS